MKLAFCTNFVSPYRRPVLRALVERFGFELRVFASVPMEGDRNWDAANSDGEPFDIVRSLTVTHRHDASVSGAAGFAQSVERHIPVGLPLDLVRFGPDAIVSGELGPRTALAFASGKTLGVPVIPWTYHSRSQSGYVSRSTGWRRRLLEASPAVVGMGLQAREVLRSLGCKNGKIHDAPNAADTARIDARLRCAEHKSAVERIRASAGGKRIAVVVGRLVEMKGIASLLEAWRALPPEIRSEWQLVFVGDGPLAKLVQAAQHEGVTHAGVVPAEEVPDWLAAADLHVFASLGDPWGLVVNEAMQCGTPTLCSTLAGCADDLIVDGVTGFLFNPTKAPTAIAGKLWSAMCQADDRSLIERARVLVDGFTPTRMAAGIASAVLAATPQPTRRAIA